MTIGNRERIVAAMIVVAAIVAVNQMSRGDRAAVLGTKVKRCSVEATRVTAGVRTIRSTRLSVNVAKGRPASVLIPPVKLGPGAPSAEPAVPVSLVLGVKPGGKGRLSVVASIHNATDCSVAVTGVQVLAKRGTSLATQTLVVFGGRERVVIAPGKSVQGRTSVPVERDGGWIVDASGSADVGASA